MINKYLTVISSDDIPELAPENECSGCAACANICPHDAISLPIADTGFGYPVVDLDACVHCGACSRVCPVVTPDAPYSKGRTPVFYSGWNNDEHKRMASSSGGVFTALAEWIIQQGGVVYGAALNEDMVVRHCRVTRIEDLEKLRGSKYVQSEIGSIFRDARKSLKEGKRVLFVGTPCQVGGLRHYLRKDHDLLLTCDVACHGVPSYRLYWRYLEHCAEQQGSTVSKISFRDKTQRGWENYYVQKTFADGIVSSGIHREDLFMRGFLSDLALNHACYRCHFRGFPRISDITLADYWGCHLVHPDWKREQGVSLLATHSKKGEEALQAIRFAITLTEETFEDATRRNPSLLQSFPEPKRRTRFMADLYSSSRPLSELIDDHTVGCRAKNDVAIIGMWMTCNYGAVLTSYALYRLVDDMGYDPVLIDHAPIIGIQRYCDTNTTFRHFLRDSRIRVSSPIKDYSQLRELNNGFDTFLLGSDQVWRYQYTRNIGLYYFLDFVQGMKRKIAFGSSFGTDSDRAPMERRASSAILLDTFDALSVREEDGVRILKDTYGLDSKWVMDPVFLIPNHYYEEEASRSSREEADPFVLSYILDPTPSKRHLLEQVRELQGKKLVNMVDAQFEFERKKALLDLENTVDDLTVEDWLWYMKSCDYLVTDSFHGMCFAIIFRKPFLCVANPSRGMSRFKSILGLLGLEDRLLTEGATSLPSPSTLKPIDWTSVEKILNHQIIESKEWLKRAFVKERSHELSSRAQLVWQECQQEKERSKDMARIQALETALRITEGNLSSELSKQQLLLKEAGAVLSQMTPRFYRSRLRYLRLMKHLSWGKRRKRYKQKIRELREWRSRAEHL